MKTTKLTEAFAGNWKIPLSLAAVVIVGIAIVLWLGILPQDSAPMTKVVNVKSSAAADQAVTREPAPGSPSAEVTEVKQQESVAIEADIASSRDRGALVDEMASIAKESGNDTKTYGSMDDFMSAKFWEEEILSLHDRGHEALAHKEFDIFREAFPDHDSSELARQLSH